MVMVVKGAAQGPVREATLRYGLVSAGLFLAALGALLSGGETPHVYGTFCALGALLTAAGVAWSLCQCYPKVVLRTIHESDSLPFLLDQQTKPRAQPLPTPENSPDRRRETLPSSSCSAPRTLHNGSPPFAPRGPPSWATRGKGAEEEEEEDGGCAVQVHGEEQRPAPRDPNSPGKPPRYEEVLGGPGEAAPHCPLCRGEEEDEEEDEEEQDAAEEGSREEETNFGASLREADTLASEIDTEIDTERDTGLDSERDRQVDTERDTVSLISETT